MSIGVFISLYKDTYIFRLLNMYDSADMVGGGRAACYHWHDLQPYPLRQLAVISLMVIVLMLFMFYIGEGRIMEFMDSATGMTSDMWS